MERFTSSIKKSLENHNWYAALFLALVLPDICANIERPDDCSKARYTDWYNRYIKEKYTKHIGPDQKEHVFLCGEDCYALRCSLLHEGGNDISNQRAQEVLDSFHFVVPPGSGSIVHMNQSGAVLQLQIDIFCKDICQAVKEWYKSEVPGNEEYQERTKSLLRIYDFQGNVIA